MRYADGTTEIVKPGHFRKPSKKQQKRHRRRTKYELYLTSDHWRELRQKVLERDGHACSQCPVRARLHVHHLTYERMGRERLDDLVTLCEDCHRKVHRA